MNEDNVNVTIYKLSFASHTSGIVGSRLSLDETLDNIKNELAEQYGPNGYEIIEFSELPPEEAAEYREMIDETFEEKDKLAEEAKKLYN